MIKAVPWQQGAIKIFGKEIPEPRLTMYYGDESYKYSGRLLAATPWTQAPALVNEIRAAVEQRTGRSFNSVLLNYYRSGSDSQGWHSDDEPVYGQNPVIASVRRGEPRS